MRKLSEFKVLIKGAGEVASGIAYRLHLSHLKVCFTEIANPLAVTRGTTFSEAVYDGVKDIMGVRAERVPADPEQIHRVWQRGNIPLAIDPEASIKENIKPDVLIDAIMAKKNRNTSITDAPLVIGIGLGFYAGRDVHVVVESNHSQNLGKVILEGEAEKNTGEPVEVGGLTRERVIWSPQAGLFTTDKDIGDTVAAGETIAHVDNRPLKAPMGGVLRGLIRSGVKVSRGTKLIEVDPVHDSSICHLIAGKVLTIGEGVLQAIMMKFDIDRSD